MICMIAALSNNNQIGLGGQMPWHIPEDLNYFRETTKGYPVIMGRKTFEAIGRLLPDRRNIVLTRDKTFSHKGIEVFHDFNEVFALCLTLPKLFIIGGGEIYRLFMPYCDQLYLTLIETDCFGDTSFPSYTNDFHCTFRSPLQKSESTPLSFSFTIWERNH